MTLIDKLSLIRGWTWRVEDIPFVVLLNQELLVYQPPTPQKEIGWVCGLDIIGSDAFLGLRIVMPGVDTGYRTPNAFMTVGAVLPPPMGVYITRYYQPNPLRTIGEYLLSVVTSAYPWPYYGPVRLYVSLRSGSNPPVDGSTELNATGYLSIVQIVIEDRNLFLKDLRKVLYGRWAPLVDLIGHVPILRTFVKKFEDLGIPFEEKELVEPPGVAR